MYRFKTFITEEPAIQASGPRGDRHAARYFGAKTREGSEYEFAKSHGKFGKGDKVKVEHPPEKIGNTWNVKVKHSDGTTHHVPISKIKRPFAAKNAEEAEDHQISSVHDQIQAHLKKHGASHVDVHMPDGRVVKDVAGAKKVGQPKGTKEKPKADMVLHDKGGKPLHYTSLKKGPKASDFQQYGGVSHMSGHPLVQHFASKVKEVHSKGGGRLHTALQMPLDVKNNSEHKGIQKHAMFGPHSHDFPHGHVLAHGGNGEHSIHNVHDIMAGNIHLHSSDKSSNEKGKAPDLHLTADKHISNGHSFKHEDHPIVIGARHGEGRSFGGMSNVRAGFYPHGWRSNAQHVSLPGYAKDAKWPKK